MRSDVDKLGSVITNGYCSDDDGKRYMHHHLGSLVFTIFNSVWAHQAKCMTLEAGNASIGKDMIIEGFRSSAPALVCSVAANVLIKASSGNPNTNDYASMFNLTYGSIVYSSDPNFSALGDNWIRSEIANDNNTTFRPAYSKNDISKPKLGHLYVTANDSKMSIRHPDLLSKIRLLPDVIIDSNGVIDKRLRAQFLNRKPEHERIEMIRSLLPDNDPLKEYIPANPANRPASYKYEKNVEFLVFALSCYRADLARHAVEGASDYNPLSATPSSLQDQCRLRFTKYPQPSDPLRGITNPNEQQRGCVVFESRPVSLPAVNTQHGVPVPASALISPAAARAWIATYVRDYIVDSPDELPGVYLEDAITFIKKAFSSDDAHVLLNLASGFDSGGEPLPMLVFSKGGGGFKDVLKKKLSSHLGTEPIVKEKVNCTGDMKRFFDPDAEGIAPTKRVQRTLNIFPYFRWKTGGDPTDAVSEGGTAEAAESGGKRKAAEEAVSSSDDGKKKKKK